MAQPGGERVDAANKPVATEEDVGEEDRSGDGVEDGNDGEWEGGEQDVDAQDGGDDEVEEDDEDWEEGGYWLDDDIRQQFAEANIPQVLLLLTELEEEPWFGVDYFQRHAAPVVAGAWALELIERHMGEVPIVMKALKWLSDLYVSPEEAMWVDWEPWSPDVVVAAMVAHPHHAPLVSLAMKVLLSSMDFEVEESMGGWHIVMQQPECLAPAMPILVATFQREEPVIAVGSLRVSSRHAFFSAQALDCLRLLQIGSWRGDVDTGNTLIRTGAARIAARIIAGEYYPVALDMFIEGGYCPLSSAMDILRSVCASEAASIVALGAAGPVAASIVSNSPFIARSLCSRGNTRWDEEVDEDNSAEDFLCNALSVLVHMASLPLSSRIPGLWDNVRAIDQLLHRTAAHFDAPGLLLRYLGAAVRAANHDPSTALHIAKLGECGVADIAFLMECVEEYKRWSPLRVAWVHAVVGATRRRQAGAKAPPRVQTAAPRRAAADNTLRRARPRLGQ